MCREEEGGDVSERRTIGFQDDATQCEQHSRAWLELILRDGVLNHTDRRARRFIISLSNALLASLLSQQRKKSEICLEDLRHLNGRQIEGVFDAIRYVCSIRRARSSTKSGARSTERSTRISRKRGSRRGVGSVGQHKRSRGPSETSCH
jgi:hypothetical protein